MAAEYLIVKNKYSDALRLPHLKIHETEYLCVKAKCALDMMTRWGMVSGVPDGEDSAGRAKVGLATEEQVVDRACKVTDLAFKQFENRGWILNLPTHGELKKELEERTESPEQIGE